jgi:hypothetical protein
MVSPWRILGNLNKNIKMEEEQKMKIKRNFTIVLTALLVSALISSAAWAKPPVPPPPPPVCGGLTGTWHGQEPSDMRWMAIHTSDSLDATKGEMLMNWIWVNPKLIGLGNTLTPGHGVWQLNSDGMYNYTWYAYVIDPTGSVTGTIRVSGVATFKDPSDPAAVTDCNTMFIYYEFEGAVGEVLVGDLGTATFSPGPQGVAYQTRVPMVVTPLPPQ